MISKLTIVTLWLGVLAAGLLGLTLSLPLQAPALVLFGVTGVMAGYLAVRSELDARWVLPAMDCSCRQNIVRNRSSCSV